MRLRFRWRVWAATVLISCSLYASGQNFSLDDVHVIAAGAPARSTSPCFRLRATIAEPVAGHSSGTGYSLIAGYAAVALLSGDDLFNSGFEGCTR